jgi:hypothetical protein
MSDSPRSEPVGLVLPAQAEGLGFGPQIAPALKGPFTVVGRRVPAPITRPPQPGSRAPSAQRTCDRLENLSLHPGDRAPT